MWDDSVKKIHLAMALDRLCGLPEYALPESYGARFYRPGDEAHWARIEVSAGEAGDEETMLKKFRRDFRDTAELERRMIFLTDGGVPFATATAWFEDAELGHLHYVAVDATHQGQGLSKPLVSLALKRIAELGHSRAMLTTQTQSWVGIKCYHGFGFRPMAFFPEEDEKEGWRIVSEKSSVDFELK